MLMDLGKEGDHFGNQTVAKRVSWAIRDSEQVDGATLVGKMGEKRYRQGRGMRWQKTKFFCRTNGGIEESDPGRHLVSTEHGINNVGEKLFEWVVLEAPRGYRFGWQSKLCLI